jgi:hypothetical protein
MAAADSPLLSRWWHPAWLRRAARPDAPGVLANVTVWLAQWRESFTTRYERVKLSRIAESLDRDLAFSRQVQHE